MSETTTPHRRSSDNQLLEDVLSGLSAPQKMIPSKYFYDERGSKLFDRICELNEYYPTRADLDATRRHVPKVGELLGGGLRLVELGSGSSLKTRLLLDALDVREYVPVDISGEHMIESAERLRRDYPDLIVSPCEGDYTARLNLPEPGSAHEATLIYFPGSSVGNFHPPDAEDFLRRIRVMIEAQRPQRGALLIGVDLKKDRRTLELAYDDAEGVTAEFNKNLLRRLNRELEADFDLERFTHRALYVEQLGRIEMHLVSDVAQRVQVAERVFDFEPGETILTEVSYKYSPEEFQAMSQRAGFGSKQFWTDSEARFGLHLLSP